MDINDNTLVFQPTPTVTFGMIMGMFKYYTGDQWFKPSDRLMLDHSILTPPVVSVIIKEAFSPTSTDDDIATRICAVVSNEWVQLPYQGYIDGRATQYQVNGVDYTLKDLINHFHFDYGTREWIPRLDLFNGTFIGLEQLATIFSAHKDKYVQLVFRNDQFRILGAYEFYVEDMLDETNQLSPLAHQTISPAYLKSNMQLVDKTRRQK